MIKVGFFGTPEFAVPSLSRLIENKDVKVNFVVTQPDRIRGRGKKERPSPVKIVAQMSDLPIFTSRSLREELVRFNEFYQEVGECDVFIVVSFGQILPKDVLTLPKCGCVNVHASLLPRWRGAAPIQRAIMAGDEITGISLMRMTEGLDEGGIYAKREVVISNTDTYDSLSKKLSLVGADMLNEHLFAIVRGDLKAIEQPKEGVTYAKKVTKEECKIKWDNDSIAIERQVRALSSKPGAFALFRGERIKIYNAKSVESIGSHGRAGEVVMVKSNSFEIKCGEGALEVLELQREGRKRMCAGDFLRGLKVKEGDIFE